MSWEYRSGRTEIESIGGSLQMLPVQAMVMMLGFQGGVPPQLTMTAGTGARMFPGFHDFFSMTGLFFTIEVNTSCFLLQYCPVECPLFLGIHDPADYAYQKIIILSEKPFKTKKDTDRLCRYPLNCLASPRGFEPLLPA